MAFAGRRLSRIRSDGATTGMDDSRYGRPDGVVLRVLVRVLIGKHS